MSSTTQQNILRKQQETTAKINSLLESSSELLACGPTCQKLKVSEQLKQKYLDAETNMRTAPEQLENSKRNYYIYTEGESYYNNMLQEELQQTSNEIGIMLETIFDKLFSYSETMNKYYNSALISALNSDELLNDYTNKNTNLSTDVKNIRSDILTNDRKTIYEEEAISKVKNWYILFWYIYFIFVLAYLLATIFVPSTRSILMRIVIFILLVTYPYYIHKLSTLIYGSLTNIYTMFPKSVYNSL